MARVAAAGISFELDAEQRQLRALAHDFADRELRPIAREWDELEDCPPELRDAKALQIVEGTSGIQRHVIVQYLRRR